MSGEDVICVVSGENIMCKMSGVGIMVNGPRPPKRKTSFLLTFLLTFNCYSYDLQQSRRCAERSSNSTQSR